MKQVEAQKMFEKRNRKVEKRFAKNELKEYNKSVKFILKAIKGAVKKGKSTFSRYIPAYDLSSENRQKITRLLEALGYKSITWSREDRDISDGYGSWIAASDVLRFTIINPGQSPIA